MAIEFRCSDCHNLLRVADDNAGRLAKCPQCGCVSQIPAEPSPAVPSPAESPNASANAMANDHTDNGWLDRPPSAESALENPYAPPQTVDPEIRRLPQSNWPLASRGKRLGGAILDGLIYFVAMLPGFVVMFVSDGSEELGTLILFGGMGIVAVYNWYLITVSGQSIAKRMLGIRIVKTDGELPGFVRGVLVRRWIPMIINQFCGLFTLVDVIFIFGEERRCIHDYMADTVVVDTTWAPQLSPSSGPSIPAAASAWTCVKCGTIVPGAWEKCSGCGEQRT